MLMFILFVFGLIIGSFINVLVLRLQANRSLGGRSECWVCHKQLKWHHNIPLVSFIVLKGRCAWCHEKISWQYPVVELGTALVMALGGWFYQGGDVKWLIGYLVLSFFSISLFIYDYKWQLLPDILTYTGAGAMLVINIWRGLDWYHLIVGALVAVGFFLVQYLLSKGTWLGLGDVILGLLVGLALGWPNVIIALILAYWLGAIMSLILLIGRKKSWRSQIPFGTFLTLATLITYLWGGAILNWYLGLVL